ncbi:MAG TPA: right-handed parallel beta-helix repeat-containing protein [Planctomycetota bacterium]|nr:right-handed parallel beta-helix repeat-containing protein [Planctomycetota bacterium]
MKTIIVLAAIELAAFTANAAEIHVDARSAQASDSNSGTFDKPLKTIAQAAKIAEPGDTVRIHDGIYRESVVVEKSGSAEKPITFEAAIGANVVITGADRIVDLQKETPAPAAADNVFSAPWPHRFIGWNKRNAHPDDNYHLLIGRAEQVIVGGYLCRQVLQREQLARGTFFADLENKRLYVCAANGADLSKNGQVEASTRTELWHSKGAFIHLRGIRFRYAANMAQHGAAHFSGANGVVEDCDFEYTNSSGAVFEGENIVARRCVFQHNGQLGFGAGRAHRLLMTECIIRDNNTKGFSRGWEAGGDKLCFCRGAVLDHCQFIENKGNGVWFDIGNEDCVVRNCLIANNDDAGIFYEISYSLHAHDNVIVGNGFADTPGAWGAASGIALSSSPNCIVERNLLIGNKEGFNFREQDRQTPRIDDASRDRNGADNTSRDRKGAGNSVWIWNHDEIIRNNVLAFNRDAQVWGWFDTRDGRHWPAAMQTPKADSAKAKDDIAAPYQAREKAGAPTGLTLETLKLTFESNLYFAAPGNGFFNWGTAWQKHEKYAGIEDVRKALNLENAGSQSADPRFADFPQRDLRVPADSPAVKLGCYPKGDVPGVKLGLIENAAEKK